MDLGILWLMPVILLAVSLVTYVIKADRAYLDRFSAGLEEHGKREPCKCREKYKKGE